MKIYKNNSYFYIKNYYNEHYKLIVNSWIFEFCI